ncbi:MAG: universal stress protein [Nitrosopumilaceae archaeon]|nr:universal stress protein [Nitrosopumilaceae archaeon]
MRQKKILVPLDGSKTSFRGLDKAIQYAKQTDADIIGLYVIKNNPTELESIASLLTRSLKKKYKEFMKTAKKKCTAKKIPFLDVVAFGEEGPKIVDYAKRQKCDMIVMGSRGMGSLREAFLGSTSHYVLDKSKIPVMIVK